METVLIIFVVVPILTAIFCRGDITWLKNLQNMTTDERIAYWGREREKNNVNVQ